ncbi:MAG: EAL domain-containing protein [Alphaproteobacteria bacterium]|nr:EAL domain-containing protein [Alphaproteobacteria bacterium]
MQRTDTRFLSFAFAGADLLLDLDTTGTITFALGAATGLADRADHQLVGRSWRSLIDPEDQPLLSALFASLLPGARFGPIQVRLCLTQADGAPVSGFVRACRLPDDENRIACTLTRMDMAGEEGAPAGTRDKVSRLLEGGAFADMAADLARRVDTLDPPASMTLIDLPDLAAVRGRLSEVAGEQLIRMIGRFMSVVAIGGQAAGRLSETRFGVVHHGTSNDLPDQITEFSRRIDPAGHGLTVRHADVPLASEGAASADAVRAIRYVINSFADQSVDDPTKDLAASFERKVLETATTMAWFKDVISTGHFDLAFQPIVMIESGIVHHFEILARFRDGKSPFETIQFAEQVGIIDGFDFAVCQRAFDHLRKASDPGLSLSVNLSGLSLHNPVLVARLQELIAGNQDLTHRIEFEITESSRLTDLQAVNNIIQAFRQRGVRVSLDDFGSGAASFQYLQALTVDSVKIDGAYIRRLGKSHRDDAMLRGIVRLAHDLGIGTVAEMVETEEQLRAIKALGIEWAQGWLYGKPTSEPVVLNRVGQPMPAVVHQAPAKPAASVRPRLVGPLAWR